MKLTCLPVIILTLAASSASGSVLIPPDQPMRWEPIPFDAAHSEVLSQIAPRGADEEDLVWLRTRALRTEQRFDTLLGSTPGEPTQPSNFDGAYNILGFDIEMTFDPDTGQIEEEIAIDLSANDDPLDIIAFSRPAGFEILEVTAAEGFEFDLQLTNLAIVIQPITPLESGQRVTLHIKASGVPNCGGGGGIQSCSFSGPVRFVTFADYLPRNYTGIMPDIFRADLRITVPSEYTVAATGRLVDTQIETDGSRSYQFTHDYETLWVSFAASKFAVGTLDFGEVPMTAYMDEEFADERDFILALSADIIAFYESRFSPFPFNNLDIVAMGKSFGGGYGPQATVMITSGIFEGSPWGNPIAGITQLMSHEIAHQWWGNTILPLGPGSAVFSEGMAEFSSAYHWLETNDSRGVFQRNAMTYLYTVPYEQDLPIGKALSSSYAHYHTLAYEKGSAVYEMLRAELGEEAFLLTIQQLLKLFGFKGAKLETLQALAEVSIGQDLDWFFDQWFQTKGFPRLEVTTTSNKMSSTGETEVSIEVRQVQEIEERFRLELPFSVTLENGERIELDPIPVHGDVSSATYTIEKPFMRISPDRDKRYLHIIRSGRAGDVNLSGDVDGTDLVDMAVMFHRDIVVEWGGNQYFWPNTSYLPRFDLEADGKIDETDLDLLIAALTGIEPPTDETDDRLTTTP